MTPTGAGFTGWLEATAAATAMRQSLWLYPIVEILHIIGFVILVGSAAMFDLRLLGLSRELPVTGMERHLLTWARASVLLIVPTGGLMFVAHATEFAGNPAFRLKLLFLVLAGLNAAVFHLRPFRQVDGRLARKFGGTGLGLSIVNGLIERHGGRLTIDSAPQQGTCASLEFPAIRTETEQRRIAAVAD